jgi:hypothetical protein
MVFTRNQAKYQQKQEQQDFTININTSPSLSPLPSHCHIIDFIDASIEWRKNKIKRDNCTFEYI